MENHGGGEGLLGEELGCILWGLGGALSAILSPAGLTLWGEKRPTRLAFQILPGQAHAG
jgi:hypothetical protein